MLMLTYNPSTLEASTEGSQVQAQKEEKRTNKQKTKVKKNIQAWPGQLGSLVRLCLTT